VQRRSGAPQSGIAVADRLNQSPPCGASLAALCASLRLSNRNMITTLSGSIRAGLWCRCPRCGEGKLFTGFLTLRPRCEVCGLDYGFADSGDGPAVFIMFLAGAIVVGAALVTEILFQPPYWVHAALWLPLIRNGYARSYRPRFYREPLGYRCRCAATRTKD